MDIYAQFVPETQRRAVVRMMDMVNKHRLKAAVVESATMN
jgi:hypothetical protein